MQQLLLYSSIFASLGLSGVRMRSFFLLLLLLHALACSACCLLLALSVSILHHCLYNINNQQPLNLVVIW